MATPSIKVEEAAKMDISIKDEDGAYIKPENAPSPMTEDDDEYEDAGDLDMSKGETLTWLVKLPDFLLERWATLDDDEEIHLANVRVYQKPNPKRPMDPPEQMLKLFLTEIDANKGIPRNYDMAITEQHVRNTYVFTEKDMPGFSTSKPKGAAVDGMPAIPARLLHPERPHTERKFGKKRFEPYFRKAIPKRTALAGTVKHEASVTPVENGEYYDYMRGKKAAYEADQKKRKIVIMDGTPAHNLLAPGTFGTGASSFDTFIKPQAQTTRSKPQESKASRMPQNELLDHLFACFKKYEFWSLKGFRDELRQPESYLKETLEQIAVMQRTGPFALKYRLKDEFQEKSAAPPNTVKPEDEDEEGMGEEDDEDEVEMEDVKF